MVLSILALGDTLKEDTAKVEVNVRVEEVKITPAVKKVNGLGKNLIVETYERPKYYRPYKLLIGPTGQVLEGGTFWFYGGAFFGNWTEFGIGQGVFTVGLADLMEVKLSLERLLSNLSAGGTSSGAMAMKIKFLDLKNLKGAFELKINPISFQSMMDTLILYNPEPVYYEFIREYNTRGVTAFVPLTFYWDKYSFAVGASLAQFGINIKSSQLPDTSNCYAGIYCDSLKAALNSPAFYDSRKEEILNFYGGYAGLIYLWRENTELIFEVNALPRILYRTRYKSDTTEPHKYTISNRYDKNTYALTVLSFLGLRYSFNRLISADAGIVIPYDMSLPPQNRLSLLNSILYANLNVIFSLKDLGL